jgi:hypothetical protein
MEPVELLMKEECVDGIVKKTNEVAHISVTVNQCMMVTINFRSDELNSTAVNLWFSSSLLNNNPLTRKYKYCQRIDSL